MCKKASKLIEKMCLGQLYNPKAKECQLCTESIQCYGNYQSSTRKIVIKNGHGLAIMAIIRDVKKATVVDLKKGLTERFPGKAINVYYYIGVLKKQGIIDVHIVGRQRYYVLR